MSDPFFDQPLPSSVEMERAILGAGLLDNNVIDEIIELIKPDEFFVDSNKRILKAMIELWLAGKPVDLITLSDILRNKEEFERVGGATYISSLIDGVPRSDTVEPYAKALKIKYRARRLIAASQRITSEAFTDPDDEELLSKAEAYIAAIAAEDTDRAELITVADAAREFKEQADIAKTRGSRITGIPTGYTGFDGRTLGLQKQELTIIAARVSAGKTTLSWNMAQNIAEERENYRGLFWSGEMPSARIGGKAIAKRGRVDAFRMRSGEYDEDKVYDAISAFNQWGDRLLICDKPHIGVLELRSICRRLKSKEGLDVLFADYLLLFANPPGITDRRDAVSTNCLLLKSLARELDMPVVLLHQMSRAVDSRSSSEEEPRLTDLAESGDVERHADVVLFLWRKRKPPKHEENVTRCFVAKQRNGPVGRFGLQYIKSEDRFENLADERGFFMNDIPDEA